jgi:hypothetical protein
MGGLLLQTDDLFLRDKDVKLAKSDPAKLVVEKQCGPGRPLLEIAVICEA